jgi:hypothetical protein
MARRVFLHIGTMKSATTYIQALCTVNADRLAEQGILCPAPGANFAAVNVLLGSSYIRPWNADSWRQLSDQIAGHAGDVFLSNEILSLRSSGKAKLLVDALAPAEVHVLLTARDLARVIPSQWQEGAANQQTAPWAEFAAAVCSHAGGAGSQLADRFWRRHDLPAILARWASSVPADRTTLVPVPRTAAPGELAGRCGEALGADFSGFEEPATTHSSLGAYSAELMRRLNCQVGDLDTLRYRTGFHKALSRRVLAPRSGDEPRIGLTAEQHRAAVLHARQMVAEIETAGVRVIGQLAELVPAPYEAGAGIDPGSATDGDLLTAALAGLAGVTLELAEVQIASDERSRRRRVDDRGDKAPS